MNQIQLQQLTSQLSQALDQNYDVLNMEIVLSVICALEGAAITKEQLEATRLAKYINQLRRRTTNDHLARRAKSLLKKWREMVGIQQSTMDSQYQQFNITSDQSEKCKTGIQLNIHPNPQSPSTYEKAFGSGVDSGGLVIGNPFQKSHMNTSDDFVSIRKYNYMDEKSKCGTDTNTSKKESETLANNNFSSVSVQSSNIVVANEKFNVTEASIIIDIVSDSDEQDTESDNKKPCNATFPCTSDPNLPPVTFSSERSKSKKSKKEKKKDKDARIRFLNFDTSDVDKLEIQTKSFKKDIHIPAHLTVSEIFSLSNSSLSSAVSGVGDNVTENLSAKHQSNSSCLSFAGRFKAASQPPPELLQTHTAVENEESSLFSHHLQSKFSHHQIRSNQYKDFIINDTSTSGSRLSPFEELDSKHSRQNPSQLGTTNFELLKKKSTNLPAPAQVKFDAKKMFDDMSLRVPKKRGRKKGSKGIDSIIAKESSLSQQILLSGVVKKVKTTKELFNEIQNRNLGNCVTKCDTVEKSNIAPLNPNQLSQSFASRPTSSCSESEPVMRSPHVMEAFLTNAIASDKYFNIIEGAEHSDSETITSDPSHDSLKFQNIKQITSPCTNSDSAVTSSIQTSNLTLIHTDIAKSRLFQLLSDLNNPKSVNEVEEIYQAQIVPCTCVVIEETLNCIDTKNNSNHDNNAKNNKTRLNCFKNLPDENSAYIAKKQIEGGIEETPYSSKQRHVRSIFDLDFEDEVPLQNFFRNSDVSYCNVKTETDLKLYNKEPVSKNDFQCINENAINPENNEAVPKLLPALTIKEDLSCVAKQRFNIQTNEVTSFHIDALHNCYIENINGNWNCTDAKIVSKSSLPKFWESVNTYTVTDGSDVVPKYGSLTYNRIKKDLSLLKFSTNFQGRRKQLDIKPFLGIAKCLSSCRKAKQVKNARLPANDFLVTKIRSKNPYTETQKTSSIFTKENQLQVLPEFIDTNDSNDIHFNSAEDSKYNFVENVHEPENQNIYQSKRSSSNCSKSSWKKNQTAINDKLKVHRSLQIEEDHKCVGKKRKKRKKGVQKVSSEVEDECVSINQPLLYAKRKKMTLNGSQESFPCIKKINNIKSSYNLDLIDSKNGQSDDDLYMEDSNDSNNDDSYAIVQKPTPEKKNHIVLTIKKNPGKINSPANSSSMNFDEKKNTPTDESETQIEIYNNVSNTNFIYANQNNNFKSNYIDLNQSKKLHFKDSIKMPTVCQARYTRHKCSYRSLKFNHQDMENIVEKKLSWPQTNRHSKLFFYDELFQHNNEGHMERLLNYTSSSSDYEESDHECMVSFRNFQKSDSDDELKSENQKIIFNVAAVGHIEKSSCYESSDGEFGIKEEHEILPNISHVRDAFVCEPSDDKPKLPLFNNGKLPSFNYIYIEPLPLPRATANDEDHSMKSPRPDNCDEVICYNKKSLDVIINNLDDSKLTFDNPQNKAHSTESLSVTSKNSENNTMSSSVQVNLSPRLEYRTGIKVIDDTNPNNSRMQQFKEWHQVLQINSYNNEPLVVLPYVVLE